MGNENGNKNSLSPTPRKSKGEVLMTFTQAMEVVLLEKKVHKLDWEDKDFYGFLENDVLKIHKPDDTTNNWILSRGDLAGTDYIIV